MNLRAFFLVAITSLAAANASVNYIPHDQVEPFAQPEPKTDSEKAAVKFKPQLDVSYGCNPYPAVQADGSDEVRSTSRHMWMAAVVWIDDPALDNSTLEAVSLNHGLRQKVQLPVEDRYLDGSSVKLESYRGFTIPRPKLRFTEQEGKSQDLITWEQLTDEARDALSEAKFDSYLIKRKGRAMPLMDSVFHDRLEDAWPF